MYLKQRPEELEKLVEIAKVQSTEASNAIEGIVTTKMKSHSILQDWTILISYQKKTVVFNCDKNVQFYFLCLIGVNQLHLTSLLLTYCKNKFIFFMSL